MCAVVISFDEHGTPSCIGPFKNLDEAAGFANQVNFYFDDDSRCRIAQMSPPPANWQSPPD